MEPAKPKPKRRRGRPAKVGRDLTLAETASLLRFDAQALARLLDAAPGVLPGAELVAGEWVVPDCALRALLGEKVIEQRLTVRDVSEALRVPLSSVYEWLKLKAPGKDGRPLLPSHQVLGRVRIYARDVAALPSTWPNWAPRRPSSFFSEPADLTASDG